MVWHGMVWYGMIWYGMVWYGMVWYGMVWYGMVWYGKVEYGSLEYGIMHVPTLCCRSTIIKTWIGYRKCVKCLCCLSICAYHTMSTTLLRPFRKLTKLFMIPSDDLKVNTLLHCDPSLYFQLVILVRGHVRY